MVFRFQNTLVLFSEQREIVSKRFPSEQDLRFLENCKVFHSLATAKKGSKMAYGTPSGLTRAIVMESYAISVCLLKNRKTHRGTD